MEDVSTPWAFSWRWSGKTSGDEVRDAKGQELFWKEEFSLNVRNTGRYLELWITFSAPGLLFRAFKPACAIGDYPELAKK